MEKDKELIIEDKNGNLIANPEYENVKKDEKK